MIFVLGQLKETLKMLKSEKEEEGITDYELIEINLLISQFEEAIEILETHPSMLMLKGEISIIGDYIKGRSINGKSKQNYKQFRKSLEDA